MVERFGPLGIYVRFSAYDEQEGTIDRLQRDNAELLVRCEQLSRDSNAWREATDRVVGLMSDADRRAESAEQQIDVLREIVATYCDLLRMANAPAHLQQVIDEAIAGHRAALRRPA